MKDTRGRKKGSGICPRCKVTPRLPGEGYCLQCRRKYRNAYEKRTGRVHASAHRRKRRAWTNTIKDVPCKDCGIKYPPYVMEFDHLTEKSFTISKEVDMHTLEELEKEVAKCEVVCSNCHKERTHRRRVAKTLGIIMGL